jgi:hypothetical protein
VVPPRQAQQARARGLHGLTACVPLNGLRSEGHSGGDQSLGVGVGDLTEQLVVQRCVDRDDREDVGGEGERIDSDTQAKGVNLGGVEGSGELVGEGPGVVVDRSAVGVVVFGVPAQFLCEFSDDASPQGKSLVVFHGSSPAGWKTPTGRTWYMPPAWPTRSPSRRCSGNVTAPAARSHRRVSALIAVFIRRRAGLQGSPIAVRRSCVAISLSVAAVNSCATASPTSMPSK